MCAAARSQLEHIVRGDAIARAGVAPDNSRKAPGSRDGRPEDCVEPRPLPRDRPVDEQRDPRDGKLHHDDGEGVREHKARNEAADIGAEEERKRRQAAPLRARRLAYTILAPRDR